MTREISAVIECRCEVKRKDISVSTAAISAPYSSSATSKTKGIGEEAIRYPASTGPTPIPAPSSTSAISSSATSYTSHAVSTRPGRHRATALTMSGASRSSMLVRVD